MDDVLSPFVGEPLDDFMQQEDSNQQQQQQDQDQEPEQGMEEDEAESIPPPQDDDEGEEPVDVGDQEEDEEEDEEDGQQEVVKVGLQEGTSQYKDIFGGDSDLSDDDQDDNNAEDNSDDEEEQPVKSKRTYQEEEPSEDERSDNEGGEDGQDGGEYEDLNDDRLKGMKFKKKAKKVRAEGEEGEEEPPKKRKKKSSSSNAQNVEEPEEYINPELAKRRALHARIEDIIKKPKGTSRKKTRGQQDDDLEAMNDEAITKLRHDMLNAANADIEENEAGKFAYHKLKLLPEVVRLMQKTSLAESIVDNGLLEAVRRWLEPLADGSLPAVNIQRPLFEILRTLTIDTSALRTCGIGKIVYFYTKCKRVEPSIARSANVLVADWMRPIIRNSKSLADREVEVINATGNERRRPTGSALARIAKNTAEGISNSSTPTPGVTPRPTNETIARRHARIPEMLTATFKVAPMRDARDRENGNGMSSSNVVVGGKMKEYKKKLIAGQQASRRV